MKILIFNWRDITNPWKGGAELNYHEQAKRWVKQGHKVALFCTSFPGAKNYEEIDGIQIYRKGSRFTVYIWAPIIYLLKFRNKFDAILDVENGIPFFTPFFTNKAKVLQIHHVHRKVFFKELPYPVALLGYFLETKLMPLVYKNKKVIAVSNTTSEETIKYLKINKKDITIVYNGTDTDFYKPNIKIKTEYPSILFLGRLMRYKRVSILPKLMSEIIIKVPNAKMYIAGNGEEFQTIKDEITKYNLKDKVLLLGNISEKEKLRLMQQSWLFVTPSSMEGWGLTVLEANACGTPSLAFNVPGLKEAIKNNYSGYLIDTEKELNEKIIKLINNKKLRDKLSKNSIKWASNFNWDTSAKKTLDLLKKVMNNQQEK